MDDIDVEEKACPTLFRRSGSPDVVASLKIEDSTSLIVEAVSNAPEGDLTEPDLGPDAMENPDNEDVVERRPLKTESPEPDVGRLSGKTALTMVTKSAGLTTMYGRTSAVSLKELMDLAGRSLELSLKDLEVLKRFMMFSMCVLISGDGVDPVCFLRRSQPVLPPGVRDTYHVKSTTSL